LVKTVLQYTPREYEYFPTRSRRCSRYAAGERELARKWLLRSSSEIDALKAEYDAIYRKILQLYNAEPDELNTTVRSLREKVDESTKAIAEKNAIISRMENEEMKAKKRAEELEKLVKIETQKYDGEVDKVKELENNKFKTQHEMKIFVSSFKQLLCCI
jgi:chromosome segregation ATPase